MSSEETITDPSLELIMTTYQVLGERVRSIHQNDGFEKTMHGLIWKHQDYYCNTDVKEKVR